jgi:hypothetical protein
VRKTHEIGMLALTKRQAPKINRSVIPIREGIIQFDDTTSTETWKPRKRSVDEADPESQVPLQKPKRQAATAVENLNSSVQERLFGAAGPADGMEDMTRENAK